MKCSYQSDYKFDQASLQIESGRETGNQYLSRGGCAFPVRTTPGQSFKKVREMINNLITRLKEDTFSEDQHKGLCGTELTTNARPQLKTSTENLTMEVAKLFAQVSHQVDNDLFVKVKKLIQDLIWKLQPRFQKGLCDTELSTTNCSETSLQEEVSNANYIHNEETTTNEESIKDVQDVQSILTQEIQILTDFYAKAGEGNGLTQQNQFSETHYTLTRNASRRTVNVEPDLQRKSDDRYQCHQLSPGDSERLREARVEDHRGRVRSGTHF